MVEVQGTDWVEPVLLWMTVSMPTGSGKSTLFRHLFTILQEVRHKCGISELDPTWLIHVDDASFEKMGALMYENSARLLGLYDELAGQIKLYQGGSLSESHELAPFFCSCSMATTGDMIQVNILQRALTYNYIHSNYRIYI